MYVVACRCPVRSLNKSEISEVVKTNIKSNSNEFVNVEEKYVHEYIVNDKKFIVTVSRKNTNSKNVMQKLKQIVINHSDTEF